MSTFERTRFATSNSSSSPTPVVMCSDAEFGKLPAINSIVTAVNQATAVPHDSHSDCSTGSSYKTAISGVGYEVCVSGTSGFMMRSNELDVTVEYLEVHINIQAPTTDSPDHKCVKSVASLTSVSTLGKSLLTGERITSGDKRRLENSFDFGFDDFSQCDCKSIRRPCIFIHGQGQKVDLDENQDSYPEYWGNMNDNAPCCSSTKYARLDTENNFWTSKSLQQKTCQHVLAVSSSSMNATIKDTIVVTHSMGNLMLAGAIANGLCSLDSTSTWVGMSGPMKGTMASEFLQDTCAGETNKILEVFGDIAEKCPPSNSVKSLAYEGGKYSSKELDAAYQAAQKVYQQQVYALMCSESHSGIVSINQPKYALLASLIPHKSDRNDGLVEFESCAGGFPESKFGRSYNDRFYRNKLNHQDMTFLDGDSLLDDTKKPLKWFKCLL